VDHVKEEIYQEEREHDIRPFVFVKAFVVGMDKMSEKDQQNSGETKQLRV
jgi:hypothetical protein